MPGHVNLSDMKSHGKNFNWDSINGGKSMNKVVQILTIVLILIGIAGCGQAEIAEPATNVEKDTVESREANNDIELGTGAEAQNELLTADAVTSENNGLNESFQKEKPYYGEANSASRGTIWPFKLIINQVNANTGDLEGSIEWLTLDAIHKVEGTIFNNRIVFKETEYIKQGNAVLSSVYSLQFDDENKQYTGTWSGTSDNGPVFLEIN